MTEFSINCLIERLISVRDKYPFSRDERGDLADAINLIYENIHKLAKEEKKNDDTLRIDG